MGSFNSITADNFENVYVLGITRSENWIIYKFNSNFNATQITFTYNNLYTFTSILFFNNLLYVSGSSSENLGFLVTINGNISSESIDEKCSQFNAMIVNPENTLILVGQDINSVAYVSSFQNNSLVL